MKLVTYRIKEEKARVGFLFKDLIVDVQKFGYQIETELPSTMLELIDMGKEVIDVLNENINRMEKKWLIGSSAPYSNAKILAPIPPPTYASSLIKKTDVD